MTKFEPFYNRHGAETAAEKAMRGPSEEELADRALLALSKLRDRFVGRDANHAACRIDEVIEHLETEARALFRGGPVGIDRTLVEHTQGGTGG